MSLLRPFSTLDLFEFNAMTHLDVWTETYGVSYYLSYLMHWGDLFSVVESAGGNTKDGDIVSLNVSLYHGGFHGDISARSPVGSSVSKERLDLIACSRECLDEAIRMCKPGVAYQTLGAIIEEIATRYGFSSNRTFGGHGINQLFHAPAPNVFHYASNRASGLMKPGQTFTIEPMICVGQQKDVHWPDKWTATTVDGKASAQFEETLLITETGVEVLTAAPGWTLPEPRGAAAAADGAAEVQVQDGAAGQMGEKREGEAAPEKKKKKAKKTAGASAAGASASAAAE